MAPSGYTNCVAWKVSGPPALITRWKADTGGSMPGVGGCITESRSSPVRTARHLSEPIGFITTFGVTLRPVLVLMKTPLQIEARVLVLLHFSTPLTSEAWVSAG